MNRSVALWKQTLARVDFAACRDFAAYSVVRLFLALIQAMPADMGDSLCRGVAWVATGPCKIRRRTTDENITRCFGDLPAEDRQRLSRAMWRNLLLMVCEVAWAQRRLHLSNWSQHVRFQNNRMMLKHLLSRRPVILVTGHFGNFEIGGYVIGLMGLSTTSVARRLDNRFLHDWVERFRSAKGQFIVDKIGSAPIVSQHLDQGGTLSLLADQHAGDKGCWVDFLGAPASCHKALALLTMTSQAPMLVCYTRRIHDQPMQFESGCVAVADPHADRDGMCQSVTSLTQWYNAQLGRAIALAVEQYWWLHRRWRTPPAKVAKKLLASSLQPSESPEASTSDASDSNKAKVA